MSEFPSSAQTAKVHIALRYMDGLEGNPIDYAVPCTSEHEIAVIQVVKSAGAKLELRQESAGTRDANDVIGRFQASPPFLFEPLVEGVIIEQPPHDALTYIGDFASIPIPASLDEEHFLVCLRPGDTVNFSEHALKVEFNVVAHANMVAPEVPGMVSDADGIDVNGETAAAEVLVKSSDPQPQDHRDENSHAYSDAETEDEDEDDSNLPPSTTPTARTPHVDGEDTPATSNPTVGEIKETPVARPGTRDTDIFFSTAPETSGESDEIVVTSSAVAGAVDKDSPLAKKTRESQEAVSSKPQSAESQAKTGAILDAVEQTPPSDAPSEELGTDFIALPSRNPIGKTYGKQKGSKSNKNGSIKRAATVISKATTSEDEVVALSDGLGDNIDVTTTSDHVSEQTDIPTTSDAPDEHSVALKAAERTLPQRGTKRGRLPKAAQVDEDEDVVPRSKKRAKREAALPLSLTAPEYEPPQATSEMTRPSKRSRITRKSAETEVGDEIAVAPAPKSTKKSRKGVKAKVTPSPQVLISNKHPRATPDSSATSTAMSGRVPKILFSKSKLADDKSTLTWFRNQGAKVIHEVPSKRTHFICVVPNDKLATTAKILRTLALGKLVVTDDWVTDSKAEGQFLEPDDFVHDALENTMDNDRSQLFKDKIVYFTKKLVADYRHEGWANIQALVLEAGARFVDSGSAADGEKAARLGEAIFFGSEEGDRDVFQLIAEHKKVVYRKDLLTQSVLRGELDLDDDEYKLQIATVSPVKKGKKR